MAFQARIIVVRSALITALSVAGSLALVATVIPLWGSPVSPKGWALGILCPLLIAWPVSAFQYWQKQRLAEARDTIARMHTELDESHRKLAAAHAALAERARRDGMTGMLNREGFFAALEDDSCRTLGGVLLIIDADHFKAINDRFGHPVGDAALRIISEAIAASIRAGDVLGRIGGEEFAVFVIGAGASEAAGVAERIRAAVANLTFEASEGLTIQLTVSIGGAELRTDRALTETIKQADGRLYEAKNLGRNQVVLAEGVSRAA
jgi:diguanylate cyclase (GGDEF)-like protein